MRTVFLALTSIFLLGITGCSQWQSVQRTPRQPILVDEYSVLDDESHDKPLSNQALHNKLEEARKHYLVALRASEQNRMKLATQHFEAAMGILNNLITYPDIYTNPEFTKLSEGIIRDYEDRVTSIDSLDQNSSMFVLRDKILQEVETIPSEWRRRPKEEPEAMAGIRVPEELQVAMTDNEPVDQCIAFFTSEKGRKFFSKWLQRSGRYFPLYERILAEEGAPQELKFLSMIESGLNTNAVSWAKAVGLWQFIPGTGKEYGMQIDWWVDERRNPEKATRAAARYLLDLYNDMGDWHLALASYNCGPGRMRSAIRRADSRDYWEVRKYLPRETQNYVPLYIAASKIAMNPEEYGFSEIEFESPDYLDTVTIKGSYDLATIAEVGGVDVETLKSANPELLRDRIPPDRSEYVLLVPADRAPDIASRLVSLPEAAPVVKWVTHKVRRGETLSGIADKYGVPLSELADVNGMTTRSRLLRGQRLKVPTMINPSKSEDKETKIAAADTEEEQEEEPASETEIAVANTVSAAVGQPTTAERKTGSAVRGGASPKASTQNRTSTSEKSLADAKSRKKSTVSTTSSRYKTHKVRRGESLNELARRYGVSISDLKAWNPRAVRGNTLLAGARLKIYSEAPSKGDARKTSRASRTIPKRYTVRRGDTLSKIARKFGVSVRDLRKHNPGVTDRNLKWGTSLRISR